jgi:hypothetical protein
MPWKIQRLSMKQRLSRPCDCTPFPVFLKLSFATIGRELPAYACTTQTTDMSWPRGLPQYRISLSLSLSFFLSGFLAAGSSNSVVTDLCTIVVGLCRRLETGNILNIGGDALILVHGQTYLLGFVSSQLYTGLLLMTLVVVFCPFEKSQGNH